MNPLTERGERLSVLIPVFNNQATLDALCTRLREALNGIDYEVLLVDDGSRDESFSTLKGLAAGNPRLKVVSLSRNFGQHPAISAALDYATGDVIALMDADLEDQPEQIPSLLRTLREAGCDIVYTTKVGAAGGARQLTSELYHRTFSRIVGVAVPRDLGTFRVFTRKVLEALRAFPERHVLYGPLMFYIGFRYRVVSAERGKRPARSSYTFGKRLRMAVNSLVTYSDVPPKFFAVFGLVMVTLPLLYAGVIVWQYFMAGSRLPRGLTIVVLLVSFLAGMIMFAIGILGVYIFRIFQEVLARPRYLVDETVNIVDGNSRDRSESA
jgi:dolichol-phosphate mannosyltransferase